MATYYVTKYALTTKGEWITVESERAPDKQGFISLKLPGAVFPTYFKIGRDVFTDVFEAGEAINAARDKKIASLEKQIAKLRKIEV